MTGTTGNISAQQIISLADEAKAIPVILSGVLDAKIAETKAAIAELVKRQGVVKTLDQAQAIMNGSEVRVQQAIGEARAKVDADAQAAATLMEQATAKMDGADARAAETADGLAKLIVQRNQVAAAQAQVTKDRADLDARQKTLDTQAATLKTKEQKLKDEQAAFNKKLEALKV